MLFESVGEIFFLLTHYYLLHPITYSFNLKWCDWCWGGTCYNISTIYCSCPFSTKQNCVRYSSISHTNCFMNLLERSFSCWLITIYYIHLLTCSIWNDVIGVEEELVTLFPLTILFLIFLNQNCIRYSISHTKCFMNLLEGSFSCWLITIYYTQLPTLSIWNGVIGVEEELVTLLPPSIVLALSQTKLCMILHVSHQLLYESVGEIFFLLNHYHLLHTLTLFVQFERV